MYFAKSRKALLLSLQKIRHQRAFLIMAFCLSIFGSSYQGYEFFRLHMLSAILSLSIQAKIAFVIWEIVSWLVSFILGAIVIPSFILMVYQQDVEHTSINFHEIFRKSKDISYRFIVLLFSYYNIIFIIAGGGLLVAVLATINNIYYGKDIITVYDLTSNMPITLTFISLGVIAASVISLLFNLISQIIVLESKEVVESIIQGFKFFNNNLAYILSAWVLLNLACLIPLCVLSVLLHIITLLAFHSTFFATFGLYLGLISFLVIYTFVIALSNIYWTEIYLNIKGKISLYTP